MFATCSGTEGFNLAFELNVSKSTLESVPVC